MKAAIFLSLCLLCSRFVLASDTSIVFRNIDFSQLFETSEREMKPVMLFFHYDECGACLEMEKKVFTNEKVYSYYNANFICFEVNTRKGKGIEINKQYNVEIHPTFLYFRPDGRLTHKIVGVFDTDAFVSQGKIAIDTVRCLAACKRRYNAGDRSQKFLLQYCYSLENAQELDSALINTYISSLSDENMAEYENLKFIYEFAFHNQEANLVFDSKAFNFMMQHRSLFYKYFDTSQVDARIVFITLDAINKAIQNTDYTAFEGELNTLKIFDNKTYLYKEMDGRITASTFSKKLVDYALLDRYEHDRRKYDSVLQKFITAIWNESDELNTIASVYCDKFNSASQLNHALLWVKRSVELKNTYSNNYTWAQILFKLGRKKDALVRAGIAIEIAKKKGLDSSTAADLVDQINKEK